MPSADRRHPDEAHGADDLDSCGELLLFSESSRLGAGLWVVGVNLWTPGFPFLSLPLPGVWKYLRSFLSSQIVSTTNVKSGLGRGGGVPNSFTC